MTSYLVLLPSGQNSLLPLFISMDDISTQKSFLSIRVSYNLTATPSFGRLRQEDHKFEVRVKPSLKKNIPKQAIPDLYAMQNT